MKRINEEDAANVFLDQLKNGYYKYDRSKNTEVNYAEKKEKRDTDAIKSFLTSPLFNKLKQIK